ncbi:uncharacterized protein LOC141611777 [Silene latifolia]|uniref:uncharacterized protein LOC141611777 n=1 Tax=Silene latifolia TaxID=37657 RepID=UPI003D77B945
MSSLGQTSWFCSLHTTKSTRFFPANHKIPSLKFPAFSVDSSKEESLPEPTSSNPSSDRIKLAFERAQKYKKSLISNQVDQIIIGKSKDVLGDDEILPGGGDVGKEETLNIVAAAIEKEGEYQKNAGIPSKDADDGKEEVSDAIRIAMEKAREYKENKGKVDNDQIYKDRDQLPGGAAEVPDAIRIAMGKASEYKKNKVLDSSSRNQANLNLTGSVGGVSSNTGGRTIEKNTNKKEDMKISSIDFVGLSFADKKSGRGLPAGLVPIIDPYPEGDLQEVEIIVGDASRFGNVRSPETENSEESSDLYKPKVSTWGMFPRPSNISETFGGGRTIRPGEALETAEDRSAKEAKTRQLLAAYKRKIGLNLDPKLKAECKKALDDGDSLMDGGRLKDALPYYQKVMDNLPFQTELHGLAALQWSICQDSLNRSEEARIMYEKLQSHPNGQVSKKARQFVFSFKAMEMLKVKQSSISPINTGLASYLEAFVEEKVNYTPESTDVKEDAVGQALPYIIILASPILLVLLVAASKGT